MIDSDIKTFLEEMDELTKKGYFGDEAKLSSYLRDKIDPTHYLNKVFIDWCKSTGQIRKEDVYEIIALLIKLYTEGMKTNPFETIEILGYFINGVPQIKESDIIRPFFNWFKALTLFRKSMLEAHKSGDPSQMMANAIDAYQKGVELVNKILTILICLRNMILGNEFDSARVFNKSLYLKSVEYKEIFDEDYLSILRLIDRDLRNAESHLNLWYSLKQNLIIYIVKVDRVTRCKKHLTPKEFFIGYLPNPSNIIQGFIFSIIIFITLSSPYVDSLRNLLSKLEKITPSNQP